MHHLDCWERSPSSTGGVDWCGCHVTNVWSWVTLSFLLFLKYFFFSPALATLLVVSLYRWYKVISEYWKSAVPCIYGGNSEVKVTRDIHHGYWWDDQRHTLIVKSTAHSVEVRVCQVFARSKCCNFFQDREWKNASCWGNSQKTHRSWEPINSVPHWNWKMYMISNSYMFENWLQIKGYQSKSQKKPLWVSVCQFLVHLNQSFDEERYQSTNNKAQQQSESPVVVVLMDNISPETVIVERYHQAENLVFLAPKQYEKIWMSISSDLDRIQATRVTINNQCSAMLPSCID